MVDPYIIETPAQLAFIEESGKKNAYFKLKNNIDLDNKAWMPITAFNGHFDGNGKTVSHLRVARQQNKVGLFGEVRNGEVKNLTLKNVTINLPECEYVGAIAGNCEMGNIDNCHVVMDGTSVIVGKKNVGGIVGCFVNDEYSKTIQPITRCSVNASSNEYAVRGTENVGGIVGMTEGHSWDSSVKIEDCHVMANIGGDSNVGGIAGYMYKYLSAVSITRCSFDGNLTATQYVGGMVGQSQGYSTGQSTVVSASKAKATITTDKGYAGGMIGFAKDLYDIQSCYAIMNFVVGGTVQNAGGLIGYQLWDFSGDCALSCSYAVTEFSLQLSKTGGIIGYSMEGRLNITDCCTTWNVAGGYSGRGRTNVTNTFTDCVGNDIINIFNDSGSKYLSHWNLRNTFTVSATVSGSMQDVVCPRLSWED